MRPGQKQKLLPLAIRLYGVLDAVYDDPPSGFPLLSPKEFKAKYVLPWRDVKYTSSDEALARLERMLAEADDGQLPEAQHDGVIVESICAVIGIALHYLRRGDREEAWSMFALAQHGLGMRDSADVASSGSALSLFGSKGGFAKAAKDPRQREKAFVKDCWKAWQDDPSRYPSKAEFARDMLKKCEHLVSAQKIEKWCKTWEDNPHTVPAE
ncbi:hypothetical protein B0G81_4328 [Paraburkholderia sp. BL6665CI2N2]|uniref:hypothetical protein n=1 Tax=Paraburkholderia sp. BL6665CI2N2 TaxID=1938806 RepID=UPI00106570E9|nr:hypothetical protein [Paraburkholderia sp. BL6665CI2N2]TDY23926.1 hypothetical protein B0G81_4328 [Paraburkholderia sp. BL6665CI2N2]